MEAAEVEVLLLRHAVHILQEVAELEAVAQEVH